MKKEKCRDKKFGITAAPSSKKFSEAIENGTINLDSEQDLDEFIKQLQNVQENEFGRTAGLNLLNINNGKNTIEFRVANGSLNPDTWIENAKLFGRIVQMSEMLAQIEKKPSTELSEDDKRLINLMEDLKNGDSENEKLETLLQLLFTEEERNAYRERYEVNSKLLKEASKRENNPIESLQFAEKLEFEKHTKSEFADVANRANIENNIESLQTVTNDTKEGVKGEEAKEERE